MTLSLVIRAAGDQEYERLRRLTTSVDLTLSQNDGTVVCRAIGPLSDWKLMWSRESRGAYWQPSCVDLQLRDREAYRLSVTVSNADTSLNVTVVPLLSGGGWDSL